MRLAQVDLQPADIVKISVRCCLVTPEIENVALPIRAGPAQTTEI